MPSIAIDALCLPVNGVSAIADPRTDAEKISQPRFSLTIPTLREAENIGGLLDRVRAALDPLKIPYEILVVDDDSRDGTEEIVSAATHNDPRVHLLIRKGLRGLSGAILHGWEHSNAEIIGVMDADLQHPPELLPQLVEAMLAGRDMVIGSRYTQGGEIGAWNPIRKLLSASAIWATWPIQRRGVRAKDPMSGFFLVRRKCIDGIKFQRSGFKLLLEVLVRARLRSVEEIPIAFGQRSLGASKTSFKVGSDYALLLAKLYACRLAFWRN
jgi:dolichol-phosphate mannosyltransferase